MTEKLETIGWREWVGLPGLAVARLKAKVDTGAKTSTLHVTRMEQFERAGAAWVRFMVHPMQHVAEPCLICAAPLLDKRLVRSSNGQEEERFVIETLLQVRSEIWPIELSLTNREEMGFRMLVGRQALKGRVLVDPARSFMIKKPVRTKKTANKKPARTLS